MVESVPIVKQREFKLFVLFPPHSLRGRQAMAAPLNGGVPWIAAFDVIVRGIGARHE